MRLLAHCLDPLAVHTVDGTATLRHILVHKPALSLRLIKVDHLRAARQRNQAHHTAAAATVEPLARVPIHNRLLHQLDVALST